MLNSHASLVTRVGAAVLRDIEGLDAASVGFERSECCGPLPEKLPGSFEPLQHHLFLATDVVPVSWDKQCSNVHGYEALRKTVKARLHSSTAAATAFFCESNSPFRPPPAAEDDTRSCVNGSALLFAYDKDTGHVLTTHYSGSWDTDQLPWEAKGVVAADRSNETFIFVCSHRRRDDRCGYCGPMLVDLLRRAVSQKLPTEECALVHVHPCSHIGGHVYAGNVLMYNKSLGGVCFGCFCPSDVDALMQTLSSGSEVGAIAISLVPKIRGRMGLGVAGPLSSM